MILNTTQFNIEDEFDMEDELENEFSQNLKIHIRVKKRNAKKCITLIEGLSRFQPDMKNMQKRLSSTLNCSCTLKKDSDTGDKYLQLSGDNRDKIKDLFISNNICSEKNIVIHGF